MRMVANKDYWRGAPKIDEVVFAAYTNPDTMVEDLKSGAIDACWGVPEAQFAPLSKTSGLQDDRLRRQGLRRARLQLLHLPLAGQSRS